MHPVEEPDRTLSCEEGFINENAFSILFEILDRIRKDGGRFNEQEEWFESVCPPPPATFRNELNSFKRAVISRTTEVRDDLMVASRSLGQLFQRISFQARVVDEYVTALKLGSGLSSLPNEILSMALEEAAYDWYDPVQTVKAATKLSHTCRRFRHLVTRIPKLWNRINQTMALERVSFCCDRLSVANADICLRMIREKPSPYPLSKFIHVTTNRSKLWRRFHHEFAWFHDLQDLKDLARATSHLDLPELSELSVAYEYFEPDHYAEEADIDKKEYRKALNYFSTWSMPRLSILKTNNFIPIPFRSATSFKTLDMTLSMAYVDTSDRELNLRALTSFLASCEVLEVLDLNIACTDGFSKIPCRRVNLDRISKATISFECCEVSVAENLFQAIHLPALRSMKLWVTSEYSFEDPDGPIDTTLDGIFRTASTFPSLIDLDLGFSIARYSKRIPVNVPFSALRSIRNLTFNSDVSLLAPLSDEIIMPSLESLRMQYCQLLDVDWIASFLGRLIHRGNLQPSRFTTERCTRMRRLETDEPGAETSFNPKEVPIMTDEMLQLAMRA